MPFGFECSTVSLQNITLFILHKFYIEHWKTSYFLSYLILRYPIFALFLSYMYSVGDFSIYLFLFSIVLILELFNHQNRKSLDTFKETIGLIKYCLISIIIRILFNLVTYIYEISNYGLKIS